MREERSRTKLCERAREYSSRLLDDELSPFEQTVLDNHLAVCTACRTFDRDISLVVERLRATPLEQPSRLTTLPERRRRLTPAIRMGVMAGAAAAAVAAFVPSLVGSFQGPSGQQRQEFQRAIASANNDDITDQRLFRITAAIPERAFLLAHGRGPHPT